MHEDTQFDLQFIRSERGTGNPLVVITRAEYVRALVAPGSEVHTEASMHLAWAYSKIRRDEDAFALYTELLADHLKLPPALYVQTLCDHARMLHDRKRTAEAERCIRLAIEAASASYNTRLISIACDAATEIALPPDDPAR